MFNEEQLEDMTMLLLCDLGYDCKNGYDIERDYHSVFTEDSLFDDLANINRDFTDDQINEAIRIIKNLNQSNVVEDNKEFTKYLLQGVPVEVKTSSGYVFKNVKLIDFDNIYNNHFQAINQFTIVEFEQKRPDIIIFVNSIPLVVVELKTATNEDVKLEDGYLQLHKYREISIPTLFRYNQFLIVSDGVTAKAGTITSPWSRFSDWKKIEDTDSVTENMPTHEKLFKGMLRKERLLDLIGNYILYSNDSKILAQYHQYFGVKKAITSTVTNGAKTGKAGILWHTQGSGKSFSMVFYTGNMIKMLCNPTIVVVTDRNDLDNQLYETFYKCSDYLKQKPVQADNRGDLKELLKDRVAGGVFFTTLQKFEEESGLFSDRDDILVLVDEAHRSHYGLEASMKLNLETMEAYKKYGTAKYLHDALPNAIYIGFTGTPVETKDRSTSSIFGDVIDTYDMTQAILDGATVPIMYESRMARVGLNQKILDEIDNYYKFVEESGVADDSAITKSKQMMARISQVIEDPDRLELIVKDIINHYEERKDMTANRAMVVAYSRKSAYIMYKKFLELRPDYEDVVNMIITPSNNDPEEMQHAIGTKSDKKELERKFKSDDANEKFRIAIVVDMWLTGFDVPTLGTMYIDKPMKAHNLMQAIARVNRVYKDKTGGLIVDYIGLKGWLLDALKTYTTRDQNKIADNEELVNALLDKLEVIDNMLGDFDYSDFKELDNTGKYGLIRDAANIMLSSEDTKRRYMKYSQDVKNLYTLCNGILNDNVKDKCLFIISVKSFISKITNTGKLDVLEINSTVGRMLEESITEDELINLGELIRGNSLELLSDAMLSKLRSMKDKNVAAEVLSRAIKTTIGDIGKINLTLLEKFSTKFNKIVDMYNERTDLADIEKIIEEMIMLKKEIEEELANGNEYGLSSEEKAFFDALGADPEIKELMQDDTLVQIAKELVELINENLTLDAFKREDARARIRSNIRRLLIKHNYPPVKREGAVEKVIKQAELKYQNSEI
ncbi:MAG: type I restriction endonuclease subunit R [Clostridium sp.]|nr:type I restriction endonuclease subunit R [Clostridium sp.]MCM1443722.1 type I restriction endonuclease subunit R [Candidatus Amulumruptor caecigallinarius]